MEKRSQLMFKGERDCNVWNTLYSGKPAGRVITSKKRRTSYLQIGIKIGGVSLSGNYFESVTTLFLLKNHLTYKVVQAILHSWLVII